jgi:chromosome segregation ATPase
MNACTIVALLGFLAAAGLLIQNLSLKKKHAGYKTIQEAIRQESTKLTILQGEQKTVQDLAVMYAASAREEEANVAAAVGQRSENQAAIEKLKTIIADLDKSAERARSELATARSQGVSVKAELEVHHEHRGDLATTIANLNKEKLTIAARVTHLLSLEARESTLRAELEGLETNIRNAQSKSQNACDEMNAQLVDTEHKVERAKKQLNSLIGQLDLYARVDGYTRVGHFEMPNYLYDTTVRYQSEIKEVRERQRKLIREKSAVTYPSDLMLCMSKSMDKKVLDGQVQLMLSAFNVECDLLIEKVGPANLDRTLEQIEKRAEALEKCCATLKCGFNTDYVELKFEECKLQFEFALKRKEEQSRMSSASSGSRCGKRSGSRSNMRKRSRTPSVKKQSSAACWNARARTWLRSLVRNVPSHSPRSTCSRNNSGKPRSGAFGQRAWQSRRGVVTSM